VKVKIKFAFPPHLNPCPTDGRRALPQGERELSPLERGVGVCSPPLPALLRGARPGTGGDIGEGEYVNFYYSFTINRERQ